VNNGKDIKETGSPIPKIDPGCLFLIRVADLQRLALSGLSFVASLGAVFGKCFLDPAPEHGFFLERPCIVHFFHRLSPPHLHSACTIDIS
jgi:hypothetical protein